MDEPRPLLRVGLTGGIASGKTTVARILAGLGAFVLDADRVAHGVMEPGGAAHDDVVARFGRELLDETGRIVRSRLASRVFHDAQARKALDAIVHPRVRTEADRRIAEEAGRAPIVVFDAALLVESGTFRDFHRLIVVRCGEQTQIRRLLERDGLSTAEARARIESQAPLERKLAVADYVIDTEKTLRETQRQTERVYAELLRDREREFSRT